MNLLMTKQRLVQRVRSILTTSLKLIVKKLKLSRANDPNSLKRLVSSKTERQEAQASTDIPMGARIVVNG